ncbi:class I SAM-dependent methyltransferase [Micromonospora marina]|uniref:class I SAM-dependent methyltransferase n=1 Tax=Micromonospora marina TaxID=307120 RepID=UPI003D719740
MGAGFSGEVAAHNARHRRGYPPQLLDAIVWAFDLSDNDTLADLGCGTGRVSLPLAAWVGAVVGVDSEPETLALARRAAVNAGGANAAWLLGADSDLPALSRLLSDRDPRADRYLPHGPRHAVPRRPPAAAPSGGVVVTNGAPLWVQDAEWARALRGCLERLLGHAATAMFQADEADRRRNRDNLVAADYRYSQSSTQHDVPLTVDDMVGAVLSAMPPDQIPSPQSRATSPQTCGVRAPRRHWRAGQGQRAGGRLPAVRPALLRAGFSQLQPTTLLVLQLVEE